MEDWQTDSNKTRKPPKILQGQALKTANATKAIALALQGYISRAVRLIESDQDKADMLAPEVQAQAKEKHPVRRQEDYWDPEDIGPCLCPRLKLDCANLVKKLDQKSAPGPSGLSNAHLWCLTSRAWVAGSEADQAVDCLGRLGELYMDNQLPTWFSYLMLGTHQLGIGKGKLWVDGNQDFRFIGIGESSRRLWWRAAFSTQGDCLREFSEPYQLALGTKGGGPDSCTRNGSTDGTLPRPRLHTR